MTATAETTGTAPATGSSGPLAPVRRRRRAKDPDAAARGGPVWTLSPG
jgi:hypothetical protein